MGLAAPTGRLLYELVGIEHSAYSWLIQDVLAVHVCFEQIKHQHQQQKNEN